MKISLVQSLGVFTLFGLGATLSTTAMAHDMGRGEHHSEHHANRCEHLPHGARCVETRGERCWESGGRFYRCHPSGGYVVCARPVETVVVQKPIVVERPVVQETVVVKRPVLCKKPVVKKVVVEEQEVVEQPVVEEQVVEQPVVEEQVVEQPVVEEQVVEQPVVEEEAVVEQPVLEEEETIVETLPARCKVVVIGGERCWERNGVYYRHCEGGYRVCHERKHWNHDKHDMGHMDHSPKHDKGGWDEHKPHHMPEQTSHKTDEFPHHKTETSHHNDFPMGNKPDHKSHTTSMGMGMGEHKPEHKPMQTSHTGMGGHMNHGGKDGKRM